MDLQIFPELPTGFPQLLVAHLDPQHLSGFRHLLICLVRDNSIVTLIIFQFRFFFKKGKWHPIACVPIKIEGDKVGEYRICDHYPGLAILKRFFTLRLRQEETFPLIATFAFLYYLLMPR